MKIVCLDQNAVSFLAKSIPGTIWCEIKEALLDGLRGRKLVCPLVCETMFESASLPLELRQSIQTLFWQLSGGMAFKAFTDMSNERTLALIRPMPDWCPWTAWRPIWAEMGYAAYKIKSDWNSGKVRMEERMTNFVRSQNLKTMTFQELFRAVSAQRSIWLCKDLDSLLEGRITEDSFNFSGLIQFLISADVSPAEIEALKRAVLYHGWVNIQIHWLEILLGTKWEYDSIRSSAAGYKSTKYEPNDEIDRKRAAMALNHADLFITEGDLASLCLKAKTTLYSDTLVLSVKNPSKILEVVRAINCERNNLVQTSAATTGLG